MLLAYRLVKLIENHSDGLARSLHARYRQCGKCSAYANVPATELTEKVYDVYHHLGEWLLGKTEADIEERYLEIGAQRAAQGVPVSQVVWMICLVRENLWDYLQKHAELERPAEIFGELELLEMLDKFFHLAIYYASLGHERATAGYSVKVGNGVCLREDLAMSWIDQYRSKLMTAREAVACVESGMRVYIHPGCAEPEALVEALMGRAPYVKDVELMHLLTYGHFALLRTRDGGALPPQRAVRRRQRARSGQRRPRRLHPDLPERSGSAVRERRDADRRGAHPGVAARSAWLLQLRRRRGMHPDRREIRAQRGRAGERADAAHLWRQLHSRQRNRFHRRAFAAAVRAEEAGQQSSLSTRSARAWPP